MRGVIKHTCARCGFQWPERTSGIYEELAAWIQHADGLEADLKQRLARTILDYEKRIESLEHQLAAAKNDAFYAEKMLEAEAGIPV